VDTDPANYLRQTGDYRCIAGSRNRYIASLPAKLRIAHLSDFAGTGEKPEVIEVYVGNDVIIGCKVPDSIPPPFVQVILVNYFDQNSNFQHKNTVTNINNKSTAQTSILLSNTILIILKLAN
jgi:hypothetical protein